MCDVCPNNNNIFTLSPTKEPSFVSLETSSTSHPSLPRGTVIVSVPVKSTICTTELSVLSLERAVEIQLSLSTNMLLFEVKSPLASYCSDLEY